jgi:hypothetical protein
VALAVLSVAGFFSWLNDGFNLDHLAVTVAELVLLLAAVVGVTWFFRWLSKARAR